MDTPYTTFPPTSTHYERRSLASIADINLSDGHAHQPFTPSHDRIIHRLPQLFSEALSASQYDLEDTFVDTFLQAANQSRVYDYTRYFLSYSSSCSITMLASLFRLAGKSVALIEPCFDNIYSILSRELGDLEVLPEEWLTDPQEAHHLENVQADVLWIVTPNNPTGSYLDESSFRRLVSLCQRLHKTLIIDFCFRFFCPDTRLWDQYRVLKDSNISFVTIEDTGKTWDTLEMKLGMVVCSDDLHSDVYRQHDDLLLNVSPFHLRLVTEFIHDTITHGVDETILCYVSQNRSQLRRELAESVLEPCTPAEWGTSLEWIRINAPFSGEQLWGALANVGIHLLPGSNFYWHNRERGRQYVRVPLARNPDVVARALPTIRQVAEQLTLASE